MRRLVAFRQLLLDFEGGPKREAPQCQQQISNYRFTHQTENFEGTICYVGVDVITDRRYEEMTMHTPSV